MNRTPSTVQDVARQIEDGLITNGYATDVINGSQVRAWATVVVASGEHRDEEFEINIRKTKGD